MYAHCGIRCFTDWSQRLDDSSVLTSGLAIFRVRFAPRRNCNWSNTFWNEFGGQYEYNLQNIQLVVSTSQS